MHNADVEVLVEHMTYIFKGLNTRKYPFVIKIRELIDEYEDVFVSKLYKNWKNYKNGFAKNQKHLRRFLKGKISESMFVYISKIRSILSL
ncbi:MAG: hypothetical protein HRT66_01585 [Flavobacteriaceae bacterium]|nr:hypothetical protein [Flavobacteriaceae bacterium]